MSGKRYKQYTDDFRANCVLMLEAAGYPDSKGALSAVSNRVKAPGSTLHRWFRAKQNPPPSNLVNEKKFDLLAELQELLKLTVTHAKAEITENPEVVGFREAVTSAAILIDKIQLLQGKPTLVLEVREMLQLGTVTPDEVVAELGDELAAEIFADIGYPIGRNS